MAPLHALLTHCRVRFKSLRLQRQQRQCKLAEAVHPAVTAPAHSCCRSCLSLLVRHSLPHRIVYLPGLEEEDLDMDDIIRDGHMMLQQPQQHY